MRKLPHSIEAEQAVLGTLLVYPESGNAVMEHGLTPNDFFKSEHQRIFEHMSALLDEGVTLDATTVVTRLKDHTLLDAVGGMSYLVFLSENSGTPSTLEDYVEIVQEKSRLRNLILSSQMVMEKGFDTSTSFSDLLNMAEKNLATLALSQRTDDMLAGRDVVDKVYQQIKDISERGSRVTGLYTGYNHLDNITSGLQRGDLLILAARPSVGKTAFALNLAMNIARMNANGEAAVAVFSLEMPASHLMMRMLSAQSAVPGASLRNGKLSTEEWNKLNEGVTIMRDRNIFIDDSSTITLSEMFAKCRKLKNDNRLDFIVIDYVQLITGRGNSDNRQQEVSEISRGLKQLARELEVPVLALSQLSRLVERREGNMPQLSDLRESGAIEQDADIVMFLYREEYHQRQQNGVENEPREEEDVKLLIRKHRNGALGDVPLSFRASINRFYPVDNRYGGDEH
ncbi:replicative DNA helicase [Erysipelothrix larvae]|uniref:Replicative DNA helicase n=1 Tax=Erysipelothrix larvae TaxID=1514105 RepID=A0A0X8H1P9_9FIRM|nr:replicative DNA helicase [Erysipelothrix larvae]AMC94465.1 replicative DNA helicase [Erysipelothrix larvae]